MDIVLRNITKFFGKKEVIKNLSITLSDGKFTTLLGPSGCGKTTLLRMIAGLETPDSGEILFNGEAVFSKEKGINRPPEKRKLSFVFQDFALWPHMTVFENVAFGLRARRKKENLEEKVFEALKTVKLDGFEKRYPHELSGGQQQRVSFARAIVVEPECILFDEPLSALDAQLREGMREEIKALTKKMGATAIFVTHDQTEAMSMSDYIAVMSEGKIEQFDTPVGVYERPATKFVGSFVGKANWISENSMVRPENTYLSEKGDEERTVTSTRYQGGKYDIVTDGKFGEWTFYSSADAEIGEKLYVGYNKDKIITFGNVE